MRGSTVISRSYENIFCVQKKKKLLHIQIRQIRHLHPSTIYPLDGKLCTLFCGSHIPDALFLFNAKRKYSGYGKYSDPLKFFTLCYIAAIW